MKKTGSNKAGFLPAAISDLREDLKELEFLFESFREGITAVGREISKNRRNLSIDECKLAKTDIRHFIKIYNQYLKQIDKINKDTAKSRISSDKYRRLLLAKNKYYRILRTTVSVLAATAIETDWQSPSFGTSLYPEAGKQTGKIIATVMDYKRDVHLDEKSFEEKFLKEYIDNRLKILLKTYLTNSGMAAFQTILTYLQSRGKTNRKIMLGKGSYFQYKQILSKTFNKKIELVDEMKTEEILKKIHQVQPAVIFLDSLCNNVTLSVANLARIINFVYKKTKKETYLIIDNACLATSFQPFLLRGKNRQVHMMTFESLNKYYQFGLDRVTAGIIVCENRDAGGIFEYRKHGGTNITDSSVYALPSPNRKLLNRRLSRHGRNALYLAEKLSEEIIHQKRLKIVRIIYPGLRKHSGHENIQSDKFYGSFLNLQFEHKFDTPSKMNKFIALTLKIAKKRGVNIIAGTSFGLNTTRIYLTSLWSKYGKPFLRISAGTEDTLSLEKIKDTLVEATRRF